MSSPRTRVTLTASQARTAFGQRLIHALLAICHDGEISLDEVQSLHLILRDGPREVNAIPFLFAITSAVLLDGQIDRLEQHRLRVGIERVVPKSVRLSIAEMLERFGLPVDDEDEPWIGWRSDPITARQLEYIRDLGGVASESMTKGQASRLIDQLLERRPPSPRQMMVLRFFDRLDVAERTKEEVSAWLDEFYREDEARERAWDRFKLDIGDDGTIRDPSVVPLGAFRSYLTQSASRNHAEGHSQISVDVVESAAGIPWIRVGVIVLSAFVLCAIGFISYALTR